MEEKIMYGFFEECYNCRLKKYVYSVDLPEKEKEAYVKRQLEKVKQAPLDMKAKDFQAMLMEEYNKVFVPKDFSQIKHYYNKKIMDLSADFEEKANKSDDPMLYTLKLALIGNYIDFDAFIDVDDDKLLDMLNNADRKDIDMEAYQKLNNDLSKAKSLVYFTDNCGEVVLDKLFIKQIAKKYPNLSITAIVRGEEVLNDASLIDAKEIGLDEVCTVVDNGLSGTKTIFANMPKDRKEIVDNADVMIAKGQANAESLNGCGLNMYYIFLCKCEKFANEYNAKKFDAIISRDKKAK